MVGAPAVPSLEGLVIVLAAPVESDGPQGVRAAAIEAGLALVRAGTRLAVVTADGSVIDTLAGAAGDEPGTPVGWRADPADPATWERLTPHIEQRLGPIDAAFADPAAVDAVRSALEPDLRRRGHGDVLVLERSTDAVAELSRRLGRTR